METYPAAIERHMLNFYRSLSERDRRRYAAVEAEKLGHGGKTYIANLFECDLGTISVGHTDIDQLPEDSAAGRVRKKGRPQES
jgi:hypothetical protein